jgi:Tfp pilus assembly protein PilF
MLNNKGVEYYNNGKYKMALQYFNRALAVSPQFEMARRNRVYCTKMIRSRRATVLKQREAQFQRTAHMPNQQKTAYAYKTPVKSHNMDYSRKKYLDRDQYGRIQKKKKSKDDVGEYMDQLGWDTYRGKW